MITVIVSDPEVGAVATYDLQGQARYLVASALLQAQSTYPGDVSVVFDK